MISQYFTRGEFRPGCVTTANNVITIGTNVSGENVSNTCYIGNNTHAIRPLRTPDTNCF
jgi:hypothetical protein